MPTKIALLWLYVLIKSYLEKVTTIFTKMYHKRDIAVNVNITNKRKKKTIYYLAWVVTFFFYDYFYKHSA